MSYSVWPEQELDHINRDRADDRLANLREASRVQNTHNVSVKRTSSSGVKGVTLTKNGKRWEANITFERKRSYLGTFDSPEEAAAAYRAASLRLVNEFTA